MKKEDFEKKGMTSREIKNKVNKRFTRDNYEDKEDFESVRLDKIDYLESIWRKKSLLDLKTRNNVYSLLDKLYAQEVLSQKWQYVTSGFDLSQAYKLDHASEDVYQRGVLAEEMGNIPKAIKLYGQAKKLALKAERRGSGSDSGIDFAAEKKLNTLQGKGDLEGSITSTTTAIIGLVGGAFFISSNVTGNVIGLSNTTSSWIGGVLILIGLVALGFWIKNKRKKSKVISKSTSKKKK